MAREKKTPSKRRTTVPVASRSAGRAGRSTTRPRPKVKRKPNRLDVAGFTVIVAVLVVVLAAIAVPLRNFYQGRSEIARLNESIAAKEAEKAELQEEIDRYQDEDFVKQEARRRLGVIEPGETAYRILDPQMSPDHSVTTDKEDTEKDQPWYAVLWDSVSAADEPRSVVSGGPKDTGTNQDETSEGPVSSAVEEAIEESHNSPEQPDPVDQGADYAPQ